jgi:hypothetical protein
MTRHDENVRSAESFVRDVLKNCFHQKADDAVVRAVAEKVSKVVPVTRLVAARETAKL